MILHFWMHWFWITASLKCMTFIAVQMISLSCIFYPYATGAGLLKNETFTLSDNFTLYKLNDSSQMGPEENITSPPLTLSPLSSVPVSLMSHPTSADETFTMKMETERTKSSTVETTSPEAFSLSSVFPDASSTSGTEAPRNDLETLGALPGSETLDVEDTFNGGTMDVYQYPLKKFSKLSHAKYGKVKLKGKSGDEEDDKVISGEGKGKGEGGEKEEEKRNREENVAAEGKAKSIETFKIVEEEEEEKRININISLSEGNSAPSTMAANVTETLEAMVASPFENISLDLINGTETENGSSISISTSTISFTAYESVEAEQPENVTVVTEETSGLSLSGSLNVTNGTFGEREAPEEVHGDAEDNLKNDTLVIENKVEESIIHTTMEPFPLRNRVAAATSTQNFELNQTGMNAGSVTGIVLGLLVVFGMFGAVSFVLYRRRYLNKPQVLHDKCSNLDSSGYIDDASLRENSEEMYSLDNDSFLNSLEAMTIQNYWTESVKHTKL